MAVMVRWERAVEGGMAPPGTGAWGEGVGRPAGRRWPDHSALPMEVTAPPHPACRVPTAIRTASTAPSVVRAVVRREPVADSAADTEVDTETCTEMATGAPTELVRPTGIPCLEAL